MADPYQVIGSALLGSVSAVTTKILLYAEVEDGVIAASLFFQLKGDSVVYFRFVNDELEDSIYNLWESGHDRVAPRSWACIQFAVQDGKFAVDFTFPEQLVPIEGLPQRRPRIVSSHFPGAKVDFSKPNG